MAGAVGGGQSPNLTQPASSPCPVFIEVVDAELLDGLGSLCGGRTVVAHGQTGAAGKRLKPIPALRVVLIGTALMSVSPFTPMTKEDVAQVLGVSIRTIENLVKAGMMPPPGRIGGRVLWHPGVFYEWLDKELRASCSAAEAPELSALREEEPDMARTGLREQTESSASAMSGCANRSHQSTAVSKRCVAKAPKLSAGERMKAHQARKLQLDDLDEMV